MSETTEDRRQYYGELNEDGSTKSEPLLFINNGRSYASGMASIREKVPSTRFFYRLEAGTEPTDEQRAEWHASVPTADKAKKSIKAESRESEA